MKPTASNAPTLYQNFKDGPQTAAGKDAVDAWWGITTKKVAVPHTAPHTVLPQSPSPDTLSQQPANGTGSLLAATLRDGRRGGAEGSGDAAASGDVTDAGSDGGGGDGGGGAEGGVHSGEGGLNRLRLAVRLSRVTALDAAEAVGVERCDERCMPIREPPVSKLHF